MLRLAPPLTLAVFLLPVLAGLAGTLLPAFGYLPALGGSEFSLRPWHDLLAWPGLESSLRLTIASGLGATLLSLLIALGAAAAAQGSATLRRAQASLPFLLAPPHAAIAIGFAFLILPSGWIARALSPELTGWQYPPDLLSVQDPHGIALTLGLILKEVPYLLLMILAALNQIDARRQLMLARSLGYGRLQAWAKVILPQLYPQLRLPIYAVLAFSLSVVDVALVLGPNTPSTLGPQILVWYSDPNLTGSFTASAAASLQLGIVLAAILLWRIGEAIVAWLGRGWIGAGTRGVAADRLAPLWRGLFLLLVLVSGASLAGQAIWSFAAAWPWPEALPLRWSLGSWTARGAPLAGPLRNTIIVGLLAAGLALLLALACLEHESRAGLRPTSRVLWLLYLPLLVPQTAFLFGLQVALVHLGADGALIAVTWSHLVFVLPYLFLSLADPWRSLDPRYAQSAAGLGASPLRIFLAVKLPILLRPLLFAFAIGFAVSAGQYLPTLFAGAGRIATLTTEAVTLSAGSDRRILGVFALAQALLPLVVFAAAVILPAWAWRRRGGLRVPA